MNIELIQALDDLEKDKGIPKEKLLSGLKAALKSAYDKSGHGSKENAEIEINEDTGEVRVYSQKKVVEEVENEEQEISLAQAKKENPQCELGDIIKLEATPSNFGRIAAQTAKQVVIQRIREAEREIVYEEFITREGDIVNGAIQRCQKDNVIVDLGRTEALLIPREQIDGEIYRPNDSLKVYIVEVEQTTKGPNILVSRTHPGLLKRLFEIEVPEIQDGTVEVKSIAREAGERSKIAVYAADDNVDPIGSYVGPNGSRVRAIVTELSEEKIDIVEWSSDIKEFVANALSPAEVVKVTANEDEDVAEVIVPDHQLSLAIGKQGQNARLAAKLTGWKIDIKSESQVEDELA
ncbi:transcription termination factor NusA [Halanaerobaculum tunisiense]